MADLFAGVTPLERSLDYHLERHNVLSSNVAHVDTPGYRPKDLARVDAPRFEAAMSVALRRTSETHLSAGQGAMPVSGEVFVDASAGAGNDGNYVSLDREAAKVAANQLRYDVISAIVSAELSQLRFAVSEGRG